MSGGGKKGCHALPEPRNSGFSSGARGRRPVASGQRGRVEWSERACQGGREHGPGRVLARPDASWKRSRIQEAGAGSQEHAPHGTNAMGAEGWTDQASRQTNCRQQRLLVLLPKSGASRCLMSFAGRPWPWPAQPPSPVGVQGASKAPLGSTATHHAERYHACTLTPSPWKLSVPSPRHLMTSERDLPSLARSTAHPAGMAWAALLMCSMCRPWRASPRSLAHSLATPGQCPV